MNALNELFLRKRENILSVYFTAGYPNLEDTVPVIHALSENGVDMIEIGMPYSDPVADGPVIQQSSMTALQNGMTIRKLFEQLSALTLPKPIPLVLMGYLNPIMQYGYEKFCRDAAACGISGFIVPDLPIEEFERELRPHMEEHGLHFIFLVTPETPDERIRRIDDLSGGFIYAVSSSSVTGRETDALQKERFFKRLNSMSLRNPVLVGFGIRDRQTFAQACRYASGGIVGTAFISRLKDGEVLEDVVKNFVEEMDME